MRILSFIAVLMLPVPAALAHHSFAIYDSAHQVTIEGTVKEFQWTNPHVWIHVLVHTDMGDDLRQIECTSVNFLARKGWTKRTLKPGDKVSITLSPLRDGSRGGSFRSVNSLNGAPLVLEPDE